MPEFIECRCGLAMYVVAADEDFIYFCEDCDPHIVELVEDAAP